MTSPTVKLNLDAIRAIKLPPIPDPTPEELRRRAEAIDRMIAVREQIGPIGISTSDLIREVRDELDGIDE
jgi:hypothetical protein